MPGPRLGAFEPLACLAPLFELQDLPCSPPPLSFLCPASPLFQGAAVGQQRRREAYPSPLSRCAEMASGILSATLIK